MCSIYVRAKTLFNYGKFKYNKLGKNLLKNKDNNGKE